MPPGIALNGLSLAFQRGLDRLDSPLDALPRAAYQQVAVCSAMAQPGAAVRFSEVDESGATVYFAVQHESQLNVVGPEAVGVAVPARLASAETERAQEYRRQHALSPTGGLAVLVQRLTQADVSAVVSSRDPIDGSDQVVVNASWGLGESLVGGTVTPDTYCVARADHTAGARQIADKRRMTVAVPGGSREVDVPRLFSRKSSLSDPQTSALAQLAPDLKVRMGWPVDLECAIQREQLCLLQCRPITTLQA